MVSERKLKYELDELRKDYDQAKGTSEGLRHQRRIQAATNVTTIIQLDAQIKEAEATMNECERKISSLEKQLKQLSNQKPTQSNYDDEFSGVNQERFQICTTVDGYHLQTEPEGYEGESTEAKGYATLGKLRNVQKKDIRVPDGVKDPNRKIYKTGKNGEQILLKDEDRIYLDDILESRPDAVKG